MSAATASLLLMPTHASANLDLKLTVLIAAGEHSPDDRHAFHWLHLRTLLADMRGSESSGADPRR